MKKFFKIHVSTNIDMMKCQSKLVSFCKKAKVKNEEKIKIIIKQMSHKKKTEDIRRR